MNNTEPTLDFRLLGHLTVSVDGESVPIGGRRQSAVLARLLLTPGQVVTMEQLVESVWDGDEPNQPHTAVRSYISNLRRAIEPNRERRANDSCLASAPPGYRLAVEPESIDWVRFEQLIGDGRRALATGNYRSSANSLRRAMELWRGEPLTGLPDSHSLAAHRGRLTTIRESALELLFEALLHNGDHALVAAEVEAAIDEHPLRERLTELGMIAFYREGRQSDALGLGQRLRSRLVEQLGISPSPSIEAVELQILNHDVRLVPAVEPPAMPTVRPSTARDPLDSEVGTGPNGATPVELLNVTGEPSAAITADIPPMLEWPVRPGPPAPADDLLVTPFGRQEELRSLQSVGRRLAVGVSANAIITGEQGIGKTTVVQSVATGLADQGVVIAWSRSVGEHMTPYWAMAQAVLSLLEQADGVLDEPLEITPDLAPLAGLGLSVHGAIAGRGSNWGEHDTNGYEQADVTLAVSTLLRRLASHVPIALIFEDMQWCDPQSIAILHYAASSLSELPFGLVLTWRETDVDGGDGGPNLRELSRLHPLIRVNLEGLGDDAILQLASAEGRLLSPEETELVHRRCDGNPLFLKEVLASPDLHPMGGRRSTLFDVVYDRVERLHQEARTILAAAALSRRPFTVDYLTSLCDRGADVVQQVLNRAVRGGVIDEVECPDGAFAFHHPVVAEVLSSDLLAVDRSAMHRSAGHVLLGEQGPGPEVCHHLSRSPEPADRLLAARIGLDCVAEQLADGEALADIDWSVEQAAEVLATDERIRSGLWRDVLTVDIGWYRSWRAWLDGEPAAWQTTAAGAVATALTAMDKPRADPNEHRWFQAGSGDLERSLGRAAMALSGQFGLPIGPTRTGDFVPLSEEPVGLLAAAAERLANDNPAKWVLQINHQAGSAVHRPGQANQKKALRDGLKTLAGARRRLQGDELGPVLRAVLEGFGEQLDGVTTLELVSELQNADPGLASTILAVRSGYSALLGSGQSLEAEQLTTKLADELNRTDLSVFDRTEIHLLVVRHMLWTGQLDAAEPMVDEAISAWTATGLPEPVPLVRQRRTIRLLRRRPLEVGHGPDEHHQLLADRGSRPELAFRLARLGDATRAEQCLDRVLEAAVVRQLSAGDLAFAAMAARLVGHEKVALTVLETLDQLGDRPIGRNDGSVIFGPASLYASLAAAAAGRPAEARRRLDAASAAVHRLGGSPASLHVVTTALQPDQQSNPPPIHS